MKRIVSVFLFLIIVLIGCEKENSSNELRKVTIEEFLDVPESSDVWYQLTGEIESIEDEEYGDFTISDETGSVYIYGMTKRKLSANDKSFSQLGLNVGDVVTLATRRTSYNGKPQGGGNPDPAYYINHQKSERPDTPQAPTKGKWVDLGLSVAWAGWNVGASKPEDFGDYFAWGETTPKTTFDSNNYIYANGPFDYQYIGEDISGTSYDAAYIKWGSIARMPTKNETDELVEKCIWKRVTYNGTGGYFVTGPNKNTIFIPQSGAGTIDGINGQGKYGYYWTSTVYDELNANVFVTSDIIWRRAFGCTIRPVSDNPNYNDVGNSDGNSGSGNPSPEYEKPDVGFYDYTPDKTSVKVQYKIFNRDEAKVSSAKIYYGTSSNPTASKSATVSGVMITATLTGLKAGTQYYVKCVATGKGGTTTTSVTKVMTNY